MSTNDNIKRPGPERRGFLLGLGAMTFLTPGVFKLGMVPLHYQKTKPGVLDEDCRVPAEEGGGVSSDMDCGLKGDDGADQDCNLIVPGGGARHEDNDCSSQSEDSDCGHVNTSSAAHTDSDCTPNGNDADCGRINELEGGQTDSDCTNSNSDSDCGVLSPGGAGASQDNVCSQAGGADGDCGTPNETTSLNQDNACNPSLDNDCGVQGSTGDANCTLGDTTMDDSATPGNPDDPSGPLG